MPASSKGWFLFEGPTLHSTLARLAVAEGREDGEPHEADYAGDQDNLDDNLPRNPAPGDASYEGAHERRPGRSWTLGDEQGRIEDGG